MAPEKAKESATERRAGPERRSGSERRRGTAAEGHPERRRADRRTGLDRRTPHMHYEELTPHPRPERNINDYPLSTDEVEFINAINDYKEKFNRPFPTWSEILHVLRTLGYERLEGLMPPGASLDDPVGVPPAPSPPRTE